jgi:hypothetical protein
MMMMSLRSRTPHSGFTSCIFSWKLRFPSEVGFPVRAPCVHKQYNNTTENEYVR